MNQFGTLQVRCQVKRHLKEGREAIDDSGPLDKKGGGSSKEDTFVVEDSGRTKQRPSHLMCHHGAQQGSELTVQGHWCQGFQ